MRDRGRRRARRRSGGSTSCEHDRDDGGEEGAKRASAKEHFRILAITHGGAKKSTPEHDQASIRAFRYRAMRRNVRTDDREPLSCSQIKSLERIRAFHPLRAIPS